MEHEKFMIARSFIGFDIHMDELCVYVSLAQVIVYICVFIRREIKWFRDQINL